MDDISDSRASVFLLSEMCINLLKRNILNKKRRRKEKLPLNIKKPESEKQRISNDLPGCVDFLCSPCE